MHVREYINYKLQRTNRHVTLITTTEVHHITTYGFLEKLKTNISMHFCIWFQSSTPRKPE